MSQIVIDLDGCSKSDLVSIFFIGSEGLEAEDDFRRQDGRQVYFEGTNA